MDQESVTTPATDATAPVSVLHTVMLVGRKSYGLGHVALHLAKEQNDLGCTARIWCFEKPDEILWAARQCGLPAAAITGFPLSGPRRLWFSPGMIRAAAGPPGGAFGVVHQHGLWTSGSVVTNILRKRRGVPTVITPHGCLDEWALNSARLKKRIALAAYERENLDQASCLHALSAPEVGMFRRFGLRNPVAVIPNGVPEELLAAGGSPDRFRRQFGLPAERRILLFLSRVTPQKGLPLLIEALHSVGEAFAGWTLVIAGDDEFRHRTELEQLPARQKLGTAVRFVGPLFDDLKRDAFAAAELFVLPSHSEGAPLVVLESLAAGVPVITTTASPWEEPGTHRCGWRVDISAAALGGALREALALPPETLAAMGERGRRQVAAQYTWLGSARKTVALYHWLLGAGPRPGFVVTD